MAVMAVTWRHPRRGEPAERGAAADTRRGPDGSMERSRAEHLDVRQ